MGTFLLNTDLEDWQTRVIDETIEVSEKIDKLYTFICRPREEINLSEEVFQLMVRQHTAMCNYRDILRERIGLFF